MANEKEESMMIEARRAYYRQWYADHKEERRSYMKEWRKSNPEKIKEYERRFWENFSKRIIVRVTDETAKEK